MRNDYKFVLIRGQYVTYRHGSTLEWVGQAFKKTVSAEAGHEFSSEYHHQIGETNKNGEKNVNENGVLFGFIDFNWKKLRFSSTFCSTSIVSKVFVESLF
jgi:hypothetical protein